MIEWLLSKLTFAPNGALTLDFLFPWFPVLLGTLWVVYVYVKFIKWYPWKWTWDDE